MRWFGSEDCMLPWLIGRCAKRKSTQQRNWCVSALRHAPGVGVVLRELLLVAGDHLAMGVVQQKSRALCSLINCSYAVDRHWSDRWSRRVPEIGNSKTAAMSRRPPRSALAPDGLTGRPGAQLFADHEALVTRVVMDSRRDAKKISRNVEMFRDSLMSQNSSTSKLALRTRRLFQSVSQAVLFEQSRLFQARALAEKGLCAEAATLGTFLLVLDASKSDVTLARAAGPSISAASLAAPGWWLARCCRGQPRRWRSVGP